MNHDVRIPLLDGNASGQRPMLVVACSERHLDLIKDIHACVRADGQNPAPKDWGVTAIGDTIEWQAAEELLGSTRPRGGNDADLT
jgi:hypothetical protein